MALKVTYSLSFNQISFCDSRFSPFNDLFIWPSFDIFELLLLFLCELELQSIFDHLLLFYLLDFF